MATRHTTKPNGTRRRPSGAAVDELFQNNTGFRCLPGLMMVKRSHIELAPQVRSRYSDQEIRSMRENISQMRENRVGSIEDTGILQPLILSPIKGRSGYFLLEAGHKRFLSTGDWDGLPVLLDELPCVAIETNARSLVQLVENVQRSDPGVMDTAKGVVGAIEESGITQNRLGELLGVGVRWVENRVKLGRKLIPGRPEYQEDLSLWIPLHSGKESATLSNLSLVSDQRDPALRRKLLAMLEKGTTLAALKKVVDEAKPAPPAKGQPAGAASSSVSDPPSNSTGQGNGSAPSSSSGQGEGASNARSSSQVASHVYSQVGDTGRGGIEIGPSTSAMPALTLSPTQPSSSVPGESSDAGEHADPQALKGHIYPANQMLALGVKLLESGELEQVSGEELREAVGASERRVGELRSLLNRKIEEEKAAQDA